MKFKVVFLFIGLAVFLGALISFMISLKTDNYSYFIIQVPLMIIGGFCAISFLISYLMDRSDSISPLTNWIMFSLLSFITFVYAVFMLYQFSD